jgi:ubiquinone biosynthesis protein COQ9
MTMPEHDAVLPALLARVPRQGWTRAAVADALRDIGAEPGDAGALFPAGAADMIAAFGALADRWMAEDAAAADMAGLRTAGRVRAVIALRLARLRPHREALRRAAGQMLRPRNGRAMAASLARTVDAVWHAAGEALEDASRHTRRATLAAVYTATLLFWLRRSEDDDDATLAFLDRRLGEVARIGKIRQRAGIPACPDRQTV